jgi:hypothetical protein
MELSEDRKKAILHVEGNLQLIACAGAGKTEIVARRVANLLKPKDEGGGGCVPANIVAIHVHTKRRLGRSRSGSTSGYRRRSGVSHWAGGDVRGDDPRVLP